MGETTISRCYRWDQQFLKLMLFVFTIVCVCVCVCVYGCVCGWVGVWVCVCVSARLRLYSLPSLDTSFFLPPFPPFLPPSHPPSHPLTIPPSPFSSLHSWLTYPRRFNKSPPSTWTASIWTNERMYELQELRTSTCLGGCARSFLTGSYLHTYAHTCMRTWEKWIVIFLLLQLLFEVGHNYLLIYSIWLIIYKYSHNTSKYLNKKT